MGLAPIKLNSLWGFINNEGVIVIANNYEKTFQFSRYGLALIKFKGQWSFIDTFGIEKICPHQTKTLIVLHLRHFVFSLPQLV